MTTVQLFGDIGLYANYKQTVNFNSVTTQNSWFNAKQHTTVQNVIYNKPQNSLKLNMEYGQAIKYSYVRLLDLDSTGRIYYFFVSQVNVIDDATVEFILEPDVIQTYMTFWTLKESMVNRAHVDRWSADSDIPIRITPNRESINCIYESEEYTEYIRSVTDGDNKVEYAFAFVVLKTDADLYMYVAPVAINQEDYLFYNNQPEEQGGIRTYPTLDTIVSNAFFGDFGIDPETVCCMGITPFPIVATIFSIKPTAPTGWYVNFAPATYKDSTTGTKRLAVVSLSGDARGGSLFDNIFVANMSIDAVRPTKPTDNANASDTFEPALYMNPYRTRIFGNSTGTIKMEIPDTILAGEDNIAVFTSLSASSQVVNVIVGNEITNTIDRETLAKEYAQGNLYTFMIDSIDVFNDAWLTYMLTQRDSDRQILNNNAISSVLQGLIFGGYGGALVTSRGTGGKDRRSLGKMATRMAPGIALGGIASAGAAIIDSHFAWENQLLEEQKIQNKAQTVSISGSNGAGNIVNGLSIPAFQVLKCDDTNYQRAYDNFRKYGYMINQFTELDINSRKYFNYVMTNGAVIGGAIPEDVRDLIASIFDAGVTIYHGDYCDTLEYPTQENIERSLMT